MNYYTLKLDYDSTQDIVRAILIDDFFVAYKLHGEDKATRTLRRAIRYYSTVEQWDEFKQQVAKEDALSKMSIIS